MPRKTKEERLKLVKTDALKIGLPERHADVLARIGVRKNLDGRICYLLSNFKEYADLMNKNKEMLNDPIGFYRKNKIFKYKGGKKFLRYGSLSYEYSQASPYNLVNILLEDALAAREYAKMIRTLDDCIPKNGEEYFPDLFEERRFSKLESAFRQDLKSNKIPEDLVSSIFHSLKYEERSIDSYICIGQITKYSILDSFYVFFSSDEGINFLEEWKNENERQKLIERFSYRFFNDPQVNLALISESKDTIDEPYIKDAISKYGRSNVFFYDGTPVRRDTIDGRVNEII